MAWTWNRACLNIVMSKPWIAQTPIDTKFGKIWRTTKEFFKGKDHGEKHVINKLRLQFQRQKARKSQERKRDGEE